jgi:transcriptional regulator with XRE-family HTH domain
VPILASAPTPNRWAEAEATLLDLPAALKTTRTRLGLTLKAAAAQIGVTTQTLSRLESGDTSNPTQTTILATLRWLATH